MHPWIRDALKSVLDTDSIDFIGFFIDVDKNVGEIYGISVFILVSLPVRLTLLVWIIRNRLSV